MGGVCVCVGCVCGMKAFALAVAWCNKVVVGAHAPGCVVVRLSAPGGVTSVADPLFRTVWRDTFLTYPSLRVPWKVVLGNHVSAALVAHAAQRTPPPPPPPPLPLPCRLPCRLTSGC